MTAADEPRPIHPDRADDVELQASLDADLAAIVAQDPELAAFARSSTVALATNDPAPEVEDEPASTSEVKVNSPAAIAYLDGDGDSVKIFRGRTRTGAACIAFGVNGRVAFTSNPDTLRDLGRWLIERSAEFRKKAAE